LTGPETARDIVAAREHTESSGLELEDRYTASLSEEGRYRLLIEAVNDYAIYMLDRTGIVSSWNPGARRFKGYEAQEIIGQHFSRFYTDEDRATGLPTRALKTAAETGKFEGEGWRVRKDGTHFWAHVVIDAVRDPDGKVIGFAKVTRDLTERHEAQMELERAREALFQSQKMEAIGQLTGGVAHDFNNLLGAILGSLELARKRLPRDPMLARLIENALQATHRGTALTKRMLAFARRQALELRPIDVPNLVRDMVELLQRSIGPAVQIETRFPLVLAPVQGDQNQLEMALLNLTVNARDAMPDGGSIVISAREEAVGVTHYTRLPPGHYVCLSVADQGVGMDAEVLARATEPFFTTKGVGKGTGLGLPMVHGVAEQSNGRFVLKSEKGKGTTAEIWLPVSTAEARAEPEDAVAKLAAPLRILAVDDDPLILFNTSAMLTDSGHTVTEATSPRHALQLFQPGAFDLVVTDHVMPGMTGQQLAEALRAQETGIPIILATGYAELPEGARGDVVILNKPFGHDEVDAAVAAALDRRR
jgi:PAS domain S-box-containing protein